MEQQPVTERKQIKHLPEEVIKMTAKTFTANGKEFIIDDSLSFDYFRQFEKLEAHVGYGVTFEEMFKTDKKLFEYLNKMDFVNAAVLVHNRLNGIKEKLEQRTHPMLLLCTLFIHYPHEDLTKYDSVIAEQKVKDWSTDYYVNDFFSLAAQLVSGFIPALQELSQDISAKVEELKKMKEQQPQQQQNPDKSTNDGV